MIYHILRIVRPFLIALCKRCIHGYTLVCKSVHQIDMVWCVDISATAISDIEPVSLAPSEYRKRILLLQWEHPIVLQQDNAFLPTCAQHLRHSLGDDPFALRFIFRLSELISFNLCNNFLL